MTARYINLHFTYLLTYLLNMCVCAVNEQDLLQHDRGCQHDRQRYARIQPTQFHRIQSFLHLQEL